MYRLIEVLGEEGPVEVEGETVQSPCIVEDDDAQRLLVVNSAASEIRAHTWARAHAAGAAAIVSQAQPGHYVALTTERFISTRSENTTTGTYSLSWESSTDHGAMPSYRDIFTVSANYDAHLVEQAKEVLVATKGFVHLHTHSEYSPMDGLATIKELVGAATADGQQALAITDHGRCAAHPELHKVCGEKGIKPIYGIEANFTDDRFLRGSPEFKDDPEHLRNATRVLNDYRHLILWAETDEGLRNLWAMSTEANLTGFHGRPRLDWDVLERFSAGVMCSTGCLRGPLARAILQENEDLMRSDLARLQSIFPDRLWVEIHCNQMTAQKAVNEVLVAVAGAYSLPVIAAVDSHYACESDKFTHQVWLRSHIKKSLADDSNLFEGNQDYHLMSETEVRKSLDYLPAEIVDQAVEQTCVVADRCQAVMRAGRSMPIYSRQGGADADRDRGVDVALAQWKRKITDRGVRLGYGTEEQYMARFEREAKLLTDKGYWGYYLVVEDQTSFAKRNKVLVGPGRGSGSGSIIAYLMGITEIDPIEAGLMFERFLTEGRDSPPDFDIDYPSSKRDLMQDYCSERWGADYTLRVGTIGRLRNKGAIRDVAAALKDEEGIDLHWPDLDKVSNIIEAAEAHTAGKGLPWDELWQQAGEDLAFFGEKYPEIVDLASKVVGRVKSYGRHAAGMVISTDQPLTGQLPLRTQEESNQPISEFDMKALEYLGLLKFDILTLRTLDTLQMCLDLVSEHYGRDIDLNSWTVEYDDPMVWDEICAGNTLGIFQIETPAGTRLTKDHQPRSIADLADVITLVRPGPKRSGLTAAYLRRRHGEEPVTIIDPRLDEILRPTYGAIIYQEQVMAVCQVLAGYTLPEADEVRRMLGKKEVERVQAAGEEFTARCVERGMDRAVADDLWNKLGEFAKYSFNKSHAWAYAMLGYWTAWFKIHYPSMFLTAILSTVDQKRIPEFAYEARRMGYSVLPPDINISGVGFKPVGGITVRYGLEQVKGCGEAAVAKIIAGQPYESLDDFKERSGVPSNITSTLVAIGAFDSLHPNRRALDLRLEREASGEAARCVHKIDDFVNAYGLPCQYPWDEEPVEIGKSGRPKKQKPPPKKCTRACRQYTPPDPLDESGIEPYTEEDIRQREHELLGAYLTSTPFDRIPQEVLDDVDAITAEEFEQADIDRYYNVAAIVTAVRPTRDRNLKDMAFIALDCRNGTIDCAVFAKSWEKYKEDIRTGVLAFVNLKKTDRGAHLNIFAPLT